MAPQLIDLPQAGQGFRFHLQQLDHSSFVIADAGDLPLGELDELLELLGDEPERVFTRPETAVEDEDRGAEVKSRLMHMARQTMVRSHAVSGNPSARMMSKYSPASRVRSAAPMRSSPRNPMALTRIVAYSLLAMGRLPARHASSWALRKSSSNS
jgi:hypothetical protein